MGKLGVLGQTPSHLAFGKLGIEGPLRRKIGEKPSRLFTDFRLMRTSSLMLPLTQNAFCDYLLRIRSHR